MTKKYLWNEYGLRLQLIQSKGGKAWNWLFLPGGPGLGSESLVHLTASLSLPGALWHVDFPGDGSNTFENNVEAFARWGDALEEGVDALDNVILVGHSSGGMFALSIPSLEHKLSGLVLMDSSPDASWQGELAKMFEASPNPQLEYLDEIYKNNPNNEILRELSVEAAPYFFTEKGLPVGRKLLQGLPYNYETCNWSEAHFDATYKAKWFPKNLPTLILSGEEDHLTPLRLFKDHPQFNQDHILLREISAAGHFPWIENPSEVAAAFNEFLTHLQTD